MNAAADREHPVRLDIGCGGAKTPGFLGVDRFALSGVDVVCDLNRPLPFADDSVDYVISSHALEHLQRPMEVLREVHRICKDGAKVTLIGPYGSTRLNQANPYHVNLWNEHTPRFLTVSETFPAFTSNLDFPRIPVFGLAESDYSSWQCNFELAHQELFYFPPYRGLPSALKDLLRRSLSDVCDEFLFHMVVRKDREGVREAPPLSAFCETLALQNRRAVETQDDQPNEIAALFDLAGQLAGLREQQHGAQEAAKAETEGLKRSLDALQQRLARLERAVSIGHNPS